MVLQFSLLYSEEILKYLLLRDFLIKTFTQPKKLHYIKQLLDEAFVIKAMANENLPSSW